MTGSAAKAREASEICRRPIERLDLDVPEIQAATLEEVAAAKAREAYRRIGAACVVEDSGLLIAALGGMPGPYVKWFEKTAGLETLCRMLDGFSDRSATAACVLAWQSDEESGIVRGEVAGAIARRPAGSNGFGWDAIFIPSGCAMTFAEMSASEKNAVSHRRMAWERFRAGRP